jgi:class 3 adenylate cyclase/tetratricopeptide (TPR) repeat protein
MHRIIPDLITGNYRAGRLRGSFDAAGMFLDISGFSVMTDALMGQGRQGAEVLAVMMSAVFDPLVDAIFGQGGMIAGYAGDSITALFPVHTDPAEAARRALAAARAAQRALTERPPIQTPFGEFRVTGGIGIAAGPASWGILRSRRGDRALYYFRGEVVEAAALAEHEAGPGQIVLTQEVDRLLQADIKAKPIGSFRLLDQVELPLPAAQPLALAPIDVEVAAAFAPLELITQDLKGEFRQTVHLFLRIPEVSDDLLGAFLQTIFDLQLRHGGLIDRVDFGDKGCNVRVLWGAPIAYENDIERALDFALSLRETTTLPLTAGVTYYISHAGYVGGRLYENYTCYGWGLNLAARFMMDAAGNEIWVDERVAQRVSERFHLEYVTERAFKGFVQKQKVFALRGRKSGSEMLFRGRMAGRQPELRRLADFVAPIWKGKYAGVLGIWGEAGMGKSRLVFEFRRSPELKNRTFHWASCQSDKVLRRPFHPFRHWLLGYFGIPPAQDPATRLQHFMAKLDDLLQATKRPSLVSDLKRARPFLAALVDVNWPDTAYEQMDAQGRYDNTIHALIALLEAEAGRQPLILCIEDAHFLDEDSRACLLRLKRSLSADPMPCALAILITSRSEGTKVLLEDNLIDHELDLGSLTDEVVSSIAEDLLSGPPASALTELVNKHAEGNPFFVEQVVRYLLEQGLLEPDPDGEWVIKEPGGPALLPADVRTLLVARLDRLTRRVKDVIQAAAVLGRAFDVEVLAAMLPSQASLQSDMAAAEHAAVWSALGETRYLFNHSLLRDVAYNMQLQSRRQELHRLACRALSDRFANELQRHYGELAYHSEQAALTADALHYLSLAGDGARDQYQNARALDFYRRALAVMPPGDLRGRFRLHRECERLLAELGRLEDRALEIDTLKTLADSMGGIGAEAEVMLLRARLMGSRGDHPATVEFAQRAKKLALEADLPAIAVDAFRSLTDAYGRLGKYQEAVAQGEDGVALARGQETPRAEAYLLNSLGLVFLEMKNPSAARDYFDKSLSMFRAGDDLRGVARALANLGLVSGSQGNYTTALDYCEQALRVVRETGERKGESALLANMGWLSGLLGDFPNARDYAERNLRIAREIGDRYAETASLINLSSQADGMGDFPAAIRLAQQGRALAQASGDRNMQAWALTYLGHGYLDSGILDEAFQSYREGLVLRHELAQPALATEPQAGLARICSARGDLAQARLHIDEVLAQMEEDGTLEGTDEPLRVYLNCCLVLNALGDRRATAVLRTAHDMLKTRANGISDPSARQAFLQNISYNREILSLWEKRHKA